MDSSQDREQTKMTKFEESYVAMILIKKRQVYVTHFSGVQMGSIYFPV